MKIKMYACLGDVWFKGEVLTKLACFGGLDTFGGMATLDVYLCMWFISKLWMKKAIKINIY